MINPFNIVIAGTPGTGKSTLADRLKDSLPEFQLVNLSKFALENGCASEFDPLLKSHIMDEDKLMDLLGPVLKENQRNIIECIHADIFSQSEVDFVFVCRTDNTVLYDRLKARGYDDVKCSNNVEAEIFQMILDDTLECFGQSRVIELHNNEESDLDKNVKTILEVIKHKLKQ